MDPFREGGIINPTSPFYQNLLGGAVLAYEGVKNFLFAQNLSSITPTAPIGCYVMVNRTSRQRYYKGEPRWLTDQGGDSDIAASLFYRNLMLEQPKVPASKWKSLEAIEVSTPVEFKPGVFSFLEMPFQELERVTNILTLDQTKKYWDMAREIATGLLILIIGLIGVALILNTRN